MQRTRRSGGRSTTGGVFKQFRFRYCYTAAQHPSVLSLKEKELLVPLCPCDLHRRCRRGLKTPAFCQSKLL
jgi:hypothetical protein